VMVSFAFFVFVRHTAHCFLLLVSCMLYVVKKHCPEEAHLNRWAKPRLIIKKSPEDLIYLLDTKNVYTISRYNFSSQKFHKAILCSNVLTVNCFLQLGNVNTSRHAQTKQRRVQVLC